MLAIPRRQSPVLLSLDVVRLDGIVRNWFENDGRIRQFVPEASVARGQTLVQDDYYQHGACDEGCEGFVAVPADTQGRTADTSQSSGSLHADSLIRLLGLLLLVTDG